MEVTCLLVGLFVYLSVCVCLPVSTDLPTYLSIFLFIFIFIYLPSHLSIDLLFRFFYLFVKAIKLFVFIKDAFNSPHNIASNSTWLYMIKPSTLAQAITLLTCIRLVVVSHIATTPTIPKAKVFHGFSQFRMANVLIVRYISNIFPSSQFANYKHFLYCLNHSQCRYVKTDCWVLTARCRIGYNTKVGKKLNVLIHEKRRPRF